MINLETYGKYRLGLTNSEIMTYLWEIAKKLGLGQYTKKDLFARFCKVAGPGNTGAMADGKFLMYRHDVERFAEKMFLGIPTFWD